MRNGSIATKKKKKSLTARKKKGKEKRKRVVNRIGMEYGTDCQMAGQVGDDISVTGMVVYTASIVNVHTYSASAVGSLWLPDGCQLVASWQLGPSLIDKQTIWRND